MSEAPKPHSELRQRVAKGLPRRQPVWGTDALPSWAEVDDARAALDELVEQLEAEREKNAKLSALIIEQEAEYRASRRASRRQGETSNESVRESQKTWGPERMRHDPT